MTACSRRRRAGCAVRLIAPVFLLSFAVAAAGQDTAGASDAIRTRFEGLDKNNDGKLTIDESSSPRVFEQVDGDGKGAVTLEELARFFSSASGRSGAGGPPAGSPPEFTGYSEHLNIRYSKSGGGDPNLLSLDIYSPDNASGAPVMAYVHGGGWVRGDKKATGSKAPFFTSRGFVFSSLNYRLLPKVAALEQPRDVAGALAWLHDNVAGYGGDPNRIYLMGHSAGAHLVALVATDDRRLKEAGKGLSIIKGLIELDTNVLDLPLLMESARSFYGRIFGDDEKLWAEISPITHVAAGKHIPPFLLVVANDNQSKLTQARNLARKLESAGGRAEIFEAPDKTHGTLNQHIGYPQEKITQTIMTFVQSIEQQQ